MGALVKPRTLVEPAFCLPGTDSDGQWQDGCGLASGLSGGPTSLVVQREILSSGCEPTPFRPNGESTVGDNCAPISQGDGCDPRKKIRSHSRKADYYRDLKEKGQRKGRSKSPGGSDQRDPGGGIDDGPKTDEEQLSAKISVLAALPQWILRSRTPFSPSWPGYRGLSSLLMASLKRRGLYFVPSELYTLW